MNITFSKLLALLSLCVIISAAAGAFAGYQAALRTPTRTPIAVVDFDAIAATLNPSDPEYAIKATALSERVKASAAMLSDQGVLVIDRAALVSSPPSMDMVLGQTSAPSSPASTPK